MKPSRVTVVRAPNSSPLTLSGTNSYLIDCGDGRGVCIDPGPPIASHVDALAEAARTKGFQIAWILVTHGHPDHAPAAAALKKRTGAKIAAHQNLQLAHDRDLHDRETVTVGSYKLVAIDAPGHTFDHLVFHDPCESALFTGDVVLGEGTVVIAPPGGAMRPYQATLARLLSDFHDVKRLYPGHGEPIDDPQGKLREYIAHRHLRETQLLGALRTRAQTIPDLVEAIYADTDRQLWPAAARQMLAHINALEDEGRIRSRRLDRRMSPQERAILTPDWSAIAGNDDDEVARAELGTDHTSELHLYELADEMRSTIFPN